MIETRLIVNDTNKLLISVIIGNVLYSTRRGQAITRLAKESFPIYPGSDFAFLHVKAFILAHMDVLKRDIAAGVHCPFHGVNFRCG
jgi:hypothetical protein